MTLLRASSLTDIGKVRKENEDRLICDMEIGVFGVADGVGGLPGGAEAAEEAVGIVTAAVRQLPPGSNVDLEAIVSAANHSVFTLGTHLSPGLGIGSTLTVSIIRESVLRLAHVGDSRAYSWRNGEFGCLTEDHSVENEARKRRAKGEVVYYSESQRGALTRCIGQALAPEVDMLDIPLEAGDRFVFCTDGVSRMVPLQEIGMIAGAAATPEEICRDLVNLAVHRGGPDNATVVALIIDRP